MKLGLERPSRGTAGCPWTKSGCEFSLIRCFRSIFRRWLHKSIPLVLSERL